MPPQFWNNLLSFGAATMQGANARTPQGFLANGSGALGPIGVGLQAGVANAQQMAKTRSELGLQGAQAANLGAESQLHGAQVAQMRQAMDLFNKYINGGAVPGLASGAPGTQPTQTADDGGQSSGGPSPDRYATATPPPGPMADVVQQAATKYGVPLAVATWVGSHESGWNPNAPAGWDPKDTGGAWQFKPATAQQYNVADRTDFAQSTDGAMRYLRDLAIKNKGDWTKVIDQYGTTSTGKGPAADAAVRQGFQTYLNRVGLSPQAAADTPTQSSATPIANAAPSSGSVPYQVAQAGNGPLPAPPMPQQPQAPLQMAPNMMPTPAPWNAGVGLGQQAAVMSLNPYTAGFGKPLEAQSQALLGLATAGPKAAATAMNSNIDLRPGGMAMIQTPSGPQWIKNPEHINIMDPGTGAETPAYISPPLPNAPAGSTGEVMPVRTASGGSVTTKLGPGQVKQLEIAPEVTKEAIKEDNEIVTKLRTVPQDSYNAQLSLLQMRPQIDAAAPGAQGQFRNDIKNFVQTWTPGIANALDWNATPGQILNKLTTLSAGKMESEDQGKRGGIGLLQTYMKANPGLELQPEADHDLTNALLITNQYRADHALGAMDFQNKQFQSAQQGGGYHKLSEYDTAFSGTFTPHPYLGAIDALNGKPDWNKGLTTQQQRLAAGVIQRADPNAMIPYQGHMVPIGQWKNVISPTDDVYPISGGKQ